MKIDIIGAGAWGTALAISAACHPQGHAVCLLARDADQARQIEAQRENQRYLPGLSLPASLQVKALEAAGAADLVIIATPMAGLRATLQALRATRQPVAWLCKGFEAPDVARDSGPSGLLGHEIQQQVAPGMQAGALSGPSFAQEVARGQPTALVAASEHAQVRDALVQAFHSPTLRVYANEDIVGVEVGGAVKNVLAIATGISDGMGLGLNARAALLTRGLVEVRRFGVAMGGKDSTFMGLSGMGDLILTATGDLSRNRRVGMLLATGKPLDQITRELGHVAEGVPAAREVQRRAKDLGIDVPIIDFVCSVLDGAITPQEGVVLLMARDIGFET